MSFSLRCAARLGREPIVTDVGLPTRLHEAFVRERDGATQTHPSSLPKATPAHPTVLIELTGHLTLRALDLALARASMQLHTAAKHPNLLFDCQPMTGYDKAARDRFIDWHRTSRGSLGRVGIVTRNSLWYVVISAMSLAAGRPMKAFSSVVAAEHWLNGPPDK